MHPSERTFSPRELATALGVSESSMKRWIDAGKVGAARTAGGHRRVPFREAVRFIRRRRMKVVDPASIGLGDLTHVPPELAAAALTADLLVGVVESGEPAAARGLLVSAYLRGDDLARLCDGPVRKAMHRLGERWRTEYRHGVALEHHATDLFQQALHHIRALQPLPEPGAPAAVGGAHAGDPYALPSLMAAAVLADLGFAVTNLGADTPVPVLAAAAREARAALAWFSVSVCPSTEELAGSLRSLAEALEGTGARVVAGGRCTEGTELPEPPPLVIRRSMRALREEAEAVLERGAGG